MCVAQVNESAHLKSLRNLRHQLTDQLPSYPVTHRGWVGWMEKWMKYSAGEG